MTSASISTYADNPKIKVVVFDFGGVIANVDENIMKIFLTNSLEISRSELSSAMFEMRMSKDISETSFWEKYTISKGKTLPSDWFEQYGSVIRTAILENLEMTSLVKDLQQQGYQTAMLSDVTQFQASIIQQMGYYNLFSPVLLSWETRIKKPDPNAFKMLLEKINIAASSVLFVDDRIENVEAAKKQGIDSIQFINSEQFKKELINRGFKIQEYSQK